MRQCPLPKTHLETIGEITVSFALMESQMQSLIAYLMDESHRMEPIITSGLSFEKLTTLLETLYLGSHGEDDDFMELKGYLTRSGRVAHQKKRITHAIWEAGKKKHPDEIRLKNETFPVQDLRDLAREIHNLAGELKRFLGRLVQEGKGCLRAI